MKLIGVIVLGAALASAQGFTTGQAARALIGQPTFTSQDSNSSDTVIGAAAGIAYAADTLFVADSNFVGASPSNNRVLLFQGLSSMLPSPTAQIPYNSKCPVCVGRATVVLGQPDFVTSSQNMTPTSNSIRLATAVASDGVHLVVADTNDNRVLIWNRIPTTNNQPADVVVGQPDLTSAGVAQPPTAKSLRGPQGVWITNGKLYIADTQNNRVLIYNRIPQSNGAAADVVLGQPNFTTAATPFLSEQTTSASATNMLNPVSATSDGVRLFVTDLGYNRVLVWNSIPASNDAPADFALGQPDMHSSVADNAYTGTGAYYSTDTTDKETPVMCTVSNGIDPAGNPLYPDYCNSTLSFPRFALSTGNRLFIADGGNDRILVFNTMPTTSGASADLILGQIGGEVNQASDAADSLRTPMSLAWDGTNLYVADAYNRRVTVYSIGENAIPYTGVRNGASLSITATGNIAFSGTIQSSDTVVVAIGPPSSTCAATTVTGSSGTTSSTSTTPNTPDCDVYTYTVKATDTLNDVVNEFVSKINSFNNGAGDPSVYANPDLTDEEVLLTAKAEGSDGNGIQISASSSTNAQITATASGSTLSGGGDAASIAPGTEVAIFANDGSSLAFQTASADLSQPQLPTSLGGVQVYINGIRVPLFSVSPTQINAQVPWEVNDSTSVNAYVRAVSPSGSVVVTTPVAITIVDANPGIFAHGVGTPQNPPPGYITHALSNAAGVISVDGSAQAGDVATVTIEDRSYSYTVQSGDTLDTIRDNLVSLINQDPKVTATASTVFDRIIIEAKVEGPEGDGLAIGASASATANVIMTALSNTLCCANVANTPVTGQNPAVAGEFVYVYATGLGIPALNDNVTPLIQTGMAYPVGAPQSAPGNPTTSCCQVSSLAGGSTADVLWATLMPGTAATFQVLLHLNSGLATNPNTQLTIAQDTYVSNVVTLPVVAASSATSSTSSAGATTASAPVTAASTASAGSATAVTDAPAGSANSGSSLQQAGRTTLHRGFEDERSKR